MFPVYFTEDENFEVFVVFLTVVLVTHRLIKLKWIFCSLVVDILPCVPGEDCGGGKSQAVSSSQKTHCGVKLLPGLPELLF